MTAAGTPSARPSRVGEEFREILAEEIPTAEGSARGIRDGHGGQGHAGPAARLGLLHDPGRRSERAGDARAGLRSATPAPARVVGRQVRLKFLPELRVRGGRHARDGRADRSRCLQQLHERKDGPSSETMTERAQLRTRRRVARPAATSVALACHVNPDADALGSMLGLSTFLRDAGCRDGLLVPERAARAAAVGRPAAGQSSRLVEAADVPARPRHDGDVRLRVARTGSAGCWRPR